MVAKTILQQLGGNKFRIMTGARSFVDLGNGLMFTLPSKFAREGINRVRVILTDADDYNVEFFKVWGSKCTLVDSVKGIYCDQLQEVFRNRTGLDTHL